jgi:hypothetical protein
MGSLPILVVGIGLVSGLMAPRWFGHIGEINAEPALTARQETLLSEFRACLVALPKQVTTEVVSPCAERSAISLAGLPRVAFAAKLVRPDWCASQQNGLISWADQACAHSRVWGYSFYRLRADSIGGGPELEITFDAKQTSTAVAWVHTQ